MPCFDIPCNTEWLDCIYKLQFFNTLKPSAVKTMFNFYMCINFYRFFIAVYYLQFRSIVFLFFISFCVLCFHLIFWLFFVFCCVLFFLVFIQ